MQVNNMTQSQKLVLFKQLLNDLISSTDLTIDILYYVFNEYMLKINELNTEYLNQVTADLIKELDKLKKDEEFTGYKAQDEES